MTSVSQLSDVQPTDWAFQALQNLIARYGCIAGYPDGTYRGFTALSRYEFAAGLNACLNNITANLDQIQLNQQDIATLNRLQQQFEDDLADLRGRVDSLEARTAELEANQFSTTTKLSGEVLFVPAFSIAEDDDAFDDEAIFGYRARLNFDTSFTGEDRLRTRLEAEELIDFSGDQLGFQAGGDSDGSFELDDLIYSFPLGPVEFVVGANGLDIDNDYSNSISPLDSSGSGAISEFADPRQYEQAFPGSGAGLGASIGLIDNDDIGLSLDVGYVADDPSSPEAEEGLFNGDYAASAQLTFTSGLVDAGVMYSNSYAGSADEFDQGVYDLDDIGATEANTVGAQVNFKIADIFEIGGGIAYSDFDPSGGEDNFEMWSYQGTIAVNDLINDGDLLGILVGVPSYTRDLEGQTDDTALLAEVFYRYRLSNNIDITPAVIVNTDPFNENDNDATVIGAIRTRFRF
ncbi:MAG: iron uptake porin [Cyanobacteria bacterium P01_A01_bin.135]